MNSISQDKEKASKYKGNINQTTITKSISVLLTLLYLFGAPTIIPYLWRFKNIKNEGIFYFICSILWHEMIWLLPNLFFLILYKYDFDFFKKYKVNHVNWPWQNENKEEWYTLLKSSIKLVMFNHFVVVPLLLLPNLIINKSPYRLDDSFPSYTEYIIEVVFFIICDDFAFYWSHRFLHINSIYPLIHKIHHRYQNTVSIAAEYAHPIEFLLGNVVPANIGAMILGKRVHIATIYIYLGVKLARTTEHHSGYEFPWCSLWFLPFAGTSSFHNYHHLYFKGNYGGFFTFWDTITGTVNKNYLAVTNSLPENPYDEKVKHD
jgi:sterol desaturase/sphingolipid hydroxylase (fatty acid hydroxylase superfamily)